MIKTTALAAMIATLTGCATLEPDAVRIEEMHVSHASQHFGSHPTSYGFNAVQVTAHWQVKNTYVDLSEGVVLEPCDAYGCGGLSGPREVFTGRVGYVFALK